MSIPRRPILISVMQYEDELAAGEMTVADVLARAVDAGVDGVEIRPQVWQDRERELPLARDLAARHGLLLTYATTVTLFGDAPDHEASLRRDIDDAQALGAALLRIFGGQAPDDADEAGWATGRALVDYATSRGVVLALENYAWMPGGTIAEQVKLLDRLPELRVNLDIANYARHGEDILTAVGLFGDRAVSAHLKDQASAPPWASYPLGAGELHLPQIMTAIEALPQRLLYCFEFRGEGDPDGRIASSVAYLRDRVWEGA